MKLVFNDKKTRVHEIPLHSLIDKGVAVSEKIQRNFENDMACQIMVLAGAGIVVPTNNDSLIFVKAALCAVLGSRGRQQRLIHCFRCRAHRATVRQS
ncbi:hypothetical protein EMIT0194P_100219 [Pseudomonas serbica]